MTLAVPSSAVAVPSLRVLPLRPGALLLELVGLEETLSLYDAFQQSPVAGVLEIVPAARTLMIAYDPLSLDQAELLQAVAARLGKKRSVGVTETVDIPVHYDGEDIADVAELLGCSTSEVVRRHTEAEYTVAFTGFAPGFAYLSAPGAELAVPRRKSPRTVVPAGSVGLAGEFSGVYPKASPGGWQLIGRTPLAMFDLARDPATLLRPGLRVRFHDIARSSMHAVEKTAVVAKPRAGVPSDIGNGIEILSSGLPVLMQDLGRAHMAAQGVSLSGALDHGNFKLANRIVGNRPGTPALEIAPAGFSFKAIGRGVVAFTGAPAATSVTSANGDVASVDFNTPIALDDGDVVALQSPLSGTRSYLAMRGGFVVEPVLGSVATDTLAQIGAVALGAGTQLAVNSENVKKPVLPGEQPAFAMPKADEIVTLDIYLGPRTDWFTNEAVESFLSQSWRVTPQSSRVGIRLSGEPLERLDRNELPSEATLRGALQVPASGQPVLFLSDHPLTGGYPVIANVAAHHLDLAGQIPVGAHIRFNALNAFTHIDFVASDPQ
ncbi:5-oxoprolinase subunit PxpB [Agrobacterium sp. AGB01]|uniref:5-oxoprolinase subunit PxpB n=1 Tax=Agrobacterium sp. AGB01 TaxID=2769302 RepID=UPI0017832EC3|nr:5-oxoprolinase subunit PxpB [Agrobacterium sp. AGB01]MBD9388401.1 5-oxoprolinase subunit PxpB [Agrobacterium sp. AGB01]